MRKRMLLFLLTATCSSFAQTGISFLNDTSWQHILERAKKENKYVFVDCYTTWCGPCKYMEKFVFSDAQTGLFMNTHFINVKFQMDTTSADPEEVKHRYSDAALINNRYNITAYPTYLFFDSEGNLVQKETGSSQQSAFLEKVKNALDTAKQYYTQVKKYEQGLRDPQFLKNLTYLSNNAMDEAGAEKYATDYIRTQTDLLSKDNLLFLYQTTHKTTDTGFHLMVQHPSKFEEVIDRKKLRSTLRGIAVRSAFSDTSIKVNMSSRQWENYSTKIRSLYPAFSEEVILSVKTMYYSFQNNWKQYVIAANDYAKSSSPQPEDLNNCAWALFQKTDDPDLLSVALKWSHQAVDADKLNPQFFRHLCQPFE